MELAPYILAGCLLAVVAVVWGVTRLEYRIGRTHLKVTLFGITLRRVALSNIRSAHKREPRGLAERWHNTFQSSHRLLTVERTRGIRYFCITPKNRYVFLSELRQAVRRVNPACEWAQRNTGEEGTAFSPERPERAPHSATEPSQS